MKSNNSRDESKDNSAVSRGKPSNGRPWCWQEKGILKLITETFAESNQAPSARSLYLALSELASDEQSASFTVNKALIAHKAGLSVKSVERLLHGFEELALVRVDRNAATATFGSIKSANTYTLLAMRHGDATSMRHGGKQGSKSDKVEESGRISEKEKKTRSPSGTRDSLREVAQFSFGDSDLLSEEQLDAIEYYNTALVPLGWLPVTKISKGLEKALDQFDGDDIRELVGAVIDDSPSVAIPTRRTLVRLLRDNC